MCAYVCIHWIFSLSVCMCVEKSRQLSYGFYSVVERNNNNVVQQK